MSPSQELRAVLSRSRARAWSWAAGLQAAWHGRRPRRCGWITAHTFEEGALPQSLGHLGGALDMRVSNNALWMNAHDADVWHELYQPQRQYDVVVFFKAMGARGIAEAQRLRERGTRVVFDANVNYYEVWGEYDVPGTRPTPEQQAHAAEMTALADHVVADSTYLLEVVTRINPRAIWIPDNVSLRRFRGVRRHGTNARPVRLVWCGMAKKAQHLLLIVDVLGSLRGAELVVVAEEPPSCLDALGRAIPCRFVRYSDRRYARTLLECDIIVSPKRLVNAYELGHTEYKITCGMAVGLPAVASPQPSYVEAIGHAGGGIVANRPEEWQTALQRLVDSATDRARLGALARRTVLERYATEVVASRYQALLRGLM
jgi:glycosyltransferase involved in cell wall biosynthesis